ncbi:hypothetical protein GCM10009555_106300 [Acrocarpospora macrocephala]|uniref:TadE-like domain-containing protein n=2 Tax=Acrocarpospora TaxID=90974 RepID=A0A5M3XQ49_9ACTN|nr:MULTISPECIES: TadE family protein [Acrocarpospora]GES15374.1 hypothetical protein Amac_089710 [Acrocarpospora macrocephala]GES23455.1 hypothetical protein Aple_063540 [Acrocarpospora pleiomorpha]
MIELAILMPVILVVVLLVVQMALWFHGRQVADAAAREGARVARLAGDSDAWPSEAEAKATQIIQAIGPELLQSATATAFEEGDQRGVEVRGTAVQVVPLLPELAFTITARSGGPIECFRPDDGSETCQ